MANPHIFGCSIVYFPGHGGNFVKLCLSLSPETVPYYARDLNNLSDDECVRLQNLSTKERFEIVNYGSHADYTKIHGKFPTVSMHYHNSLINNYYQWAVMGNHPDDLPAVLPWLKKIFYLELDLKKYSAWILKSKHYFSRNRMFFPEQAKDLYKQNLSEDQKQLENFVLTQSITDTLSMTAMLDSQQGFEQQYQKACESLQITPVMDYAIQYYNNWRRIRVDPFL